MTERPEITIRHNEDQDRFAVVSLIEDNGLAKNRPDGYVQGKIDQRKIYVAETEGNVVGAIVIDGPHKHGAPRINYIAVDENYRGLGIGRSLILQAEKVLRRMGATRVRLKAQDAKPGLVSFYQGLGFQLVEADGEMQKRLK